MLYSKLERISNNTLCITKINSSKRDKILIFHYESLIKSLWCFFSSPSSSFWYKTNLFLSDTNPHLADWSAHRLLPCGLGIQILALKVVASLLFATVFCLQLKHWSTKVNMLNFDQSKIYKVLKGILLNLN